MDFNIKQFTFLMTFLLVFSCVLSQGNLQFNQTLYFPLSLSVGQTSTSQSIVVPVGKTLKVENAGCGFINNIAATFSNGYFAELYLDNNLIYSNVPPCGGNSLSKNLPSFPIWLPAGTYLLNYVLGGATNVASKSFISGIEFNIIP